MPNDYSLVAQRLNRIEPRRTPGRVERKYERQAEGQYWRSDLHDVMPVHNGRHARQEINFRRERWISLGDLACTI